MSSEVTRPRLVDYLLAIIDGGGKDGRPSHKKMVAFTSWVIGVVLGVVFVRRNAPYPFLLSWWALVFLLPYGLKGILAWLEKRP